MQTIEAENINAEIELAKNLKLIENLAKTKMSREAVTRYSNLKLAHTEKAVRAISFIAQGVQSGKINDQISDEQFKSLLMGI